MPINLGIEFCKPRHAKDYWMAQFRNHTKFNSYWSGTRCKLHKKNVAIYVGDNTKFIRQV